MVPTVEQVLLAQIQKENQDRPTLGQAAGTGAAIGGLAGLLGADGKFDREIIASRLRGESAPIRGTKIRMAGGLMGAILGGTLGAGTQQLMRQNSTTADLLAKLQTGDLSAQDQQALQSVLADSYRNVLGM